VALCQTRAGARRHSEVGGHYAGQPDQPRSGQSDLPRPQAHGQAAPAEPTSKAILVGRIGGSTTDSVTVSLSNRSFIKDKPSGAGERQGDSSSSFRCTGPTKADLVCGDVLPIDAGTDLGVRFASHSDIDDQ
jgi:hypothetical protein